MSKIGRNDKCSCGSSKKYKHCCLNGKNKIDDDIIPIIQAPSILHTRTIVENKINESNSNFNHSEFLHKFLAANKITSISALVNNEAEINILFCAIEQEIVNICSKHSVYELIFWNSRIKPINRYKQSDETAYNYHEVMVKAIFNFGTKREVFINTDVSSHPSYLDGFTLENIMTKAIPDEVINVIANLYMLESICSYYIYLKNCYRVYLKGGRLIEDSRMGINVTVDNSDVQYLINLYDSRTKNMSLLTNIGTYSLDDIGKEEFIFAVLQYNFNNKIIDFPAVKVDGSTNFVYAIFNIESYYNVLKNFNDVIFNKYEFYVEDILSILMWASYKLIEHISQLYDEKTDASELGKSIEVIQRGYALYLEKEKIKMLESIEELYTEKFGAVRKMSKKNILNAFNHLFHRSSGFDSLEENTLMDFLFYRLSIDKFIIRCTSFDNILRGFVSCLRSIDGSDGNKISSDFEDKVNEKIAQIFGEASIYHRGELQAKNGKKKEIDASFIYNNYLFVIECKSLSVSNGYIFGSLSSLNFRKTKLLGYLEESKRKCEFLAQHCEDLSVLYPKEIIGIIPIVATSFPEYIWEKSNNLFLTENLCRIIIPQEIELFKDDEVTKSLNTAPFVVYPKRK